MDQASSRTNVPLEAGQAEFEGVLHKATSIKG